MPVLVIAFLFIVIVITIKYYIFVAKIIIHS